MIKDYAGVVFKKSGQVYYFNSNNIKLKNGDNVIVDTEQGPQFATVIKTNNDISEIILPKKINNVIRICSKKDIANNQNNIQLAKKALLKCKSMVEKQNLNMMVLDANYNFDRSQLVFTFLSDNRVDFRKLAKDLAAIYKTRIELRQVGVRDKAKEVGGYGLCGRELCCLKYEDECYKECNKKLPKVGKKISTKLGTGKVISVDPLKMIYKVDLGDQGIMEFNSNEDN